MTDLSDALFKGCLTGATRSVVVGRPVVLKSRTGPADRPLPIATNLVDELTFPARLHSFRRITSCSISLLSDKSATRADSAIRQRRTQTEIGPILRHRVIVLFLPSLPQQYSNKKCCISRSHGRVEYYCVFGRHEHYSLSGCQPIASSFVGGANSGRPIRSQVEI